MLKAEDEDIAKLHKSVLLQEVLTAFGLEKKALLKREVRIIDATLGLGGHTLALLERGATVLGIDTDLEMLELARRRLKIACPIPEEKGERIPRGSYKLVYGNFRQIGDIAKNNNFLEVDGILFDLGVSSPQILSESRGFSFKNENAVLDMRIDPNSQSVKAKDLLNLLREDQLKTLFGRFMNFSVSSRLARAVVERRLGGQFTKVSDFASVVAKNIYKKNNLDLMTLPLMALRIAVNSELENLKEGLSESLGLVKSGGRVAVISFHSGEDGIVKRLFRDWEEKGVGLSVNKSVIAPKPEEISENPKARSAKFRVFQKS